jgi:hypothetical protein
MYCFRRVRPDLPFGPRQKFQPSTYANVRFRSQTKSQIAQRRKSQSIFNWKLLRIANLIIDLWSVSAQRVDISENLQKLKKSQT